MWLATANVFQPRWTEEIHAEWMRNVLKNSPELAEAKLDRTRRLMDRIDEKCLVTGYEEYIASLILPDPDDWHVAAAAIRADASIIVTFNLADFPLTALKTSWHSRTTPGQVSGSIVR